MISLKKSFARENSWMWPCLGSAEDHLGNGSQRSSRFSRKRKIHPTTSSLFRRRSRHRREQTWCCQCRPNTGPRQSRKASFEVGEFHPQTPGRVFVCVIFHCFRLPWTFGCGWRRNTWKIAPLQTSRVLSCFAGDTARRFRHFGTSWKIWSGRVSVCHGCLILDWKSKVQCRWPFDRPRRSRNNCNLGKDNRLKK